MFEHSPEDEYVAKHNGYCSRCFHTFWKNETVVKNPQGFVHLDCLVALSDETPRKISKRYSHIYAVDKDKLKQKAKKRIITNE